MDNKTQKTQILEVLMMGKTITPIEALNEFGCFRLGARLYDLKQEGYDIRMRLVGKEKKYAEYFINHPGVRRVF